MIDLRSTPWQVPERIFLTTYDRADHAVTTLERGVVGINVDGKRGGSTASRLQVGNWVLVRVTGEFRNEKDLVVIRPGRVSKPLVLEKPDRPGSHPWPRLLWPEEVETQKLIYRLRIPVSFEGAPALRLGCFTWARLRELGFKGADGEPLATPQQWGIKFSGSLIDKRREVEAIVRLIDVCASIVASTSE
jgi:hypothetical protein